MKQILAIVLATAIGMAFAADSQQTKKVPDRTKIRAKLQQKIEARKKRIEAEGGLIQSINNGNVVAVLSTQKILSKEVVERCAKVIPEKMRYPMEFEVVDQVTGELLANAHYGAVIYVGEFAGNQMLLLNPDRPLAMIDIKALASDGASAEVLEKRLSKMIVRATSMALGVGSAFLGRFAGLKDLDEMNQVSFPAEAYNAISETARRSGINPVRFVTYKAACEEGWAPAPSTEVQKAVLEQVKAEQSKQPKKGIKIEYDPKKGK